MGATDETGAEVLRTVIQRVSQARVRVSGEIVGEIGCGLLVLVGFGPDDSETDLVWMGDRLWGMRIFPDADGKMNLSARDVGGGLLLVSQFTLYGDAARGRRPSFGRAAPADIAERLYRRFVDICRTGGQVAEGRFGAMMDVESVNHGPVTLWLER